MYVILLGAGYQADHLRDVLRQAERVPLAHHRHPQLPVLLPKGASAHDAWSVQPAPGVHPRGHQGHCGIRTSQVIFPHKTKPFFRGVRVLPEFDAPAHVGNGWQFGESEGKGKLAVCVNQEPWQVSYDLFVLCMLCRTIVWNLHVGSSTLSTLMSTPPWESSTRTSLSSLTRTCSTWGETRST